MRMRVECIRIFYAFQLKFDFLRFVLIFLAQNVGITFFFSTLAPEMSLKA